MQPADLLPCSLGGFYEVSGIGGSGAHFKGFVTDITENCTAVSHGGIAIELNGLRYSGKFKSIEAGKQVSNNNDISW